MRYPQAPALRKHELVSCGASRRLLIIATIDARRDVKYNVLFSAQHSKLKRCIVEGFVFKVAIIGYVIQIALSKQARQGR